MVKIYNFSDGFEHDEWVGLSADTSNSRKTPLNGKLE